MFPGALFACVVLALAALLWVAWLVWGLLDPTGQDNVDHDFRRRFRRELSWVHQHVIVALVIVAVLAIAIPPASYQLGYHQGYNAAYFIKNEGLGLKEPTTRLPAPIVGTSPVKISAPPSATINLVTYPSVGNQGSIGSCAAWASAWDLSFEYRQDHPGSTVRFSPRCEYDAYSCAYNSCRDRGSNFESDTSIFATTGDPRISQVPYGAKALRHGLQAYSMEQTPSACSVLGAPYKSTVTYYPQTGYQVGAGVQAIVTAIHGVITGQTTVDGKPHPLMVAFHVFDQYEAASQANGALVGEPALNAQGQPKETDYGGHGNVILGYDDTKLMPDGSVGAALVQNQWTKNWGVGGRAWLSYKYLADWSWDLTYATLTSPGVAVSAEQPPSYQPNTNPGIPALQGSITAQPPTIGAVSKGRAGWYVHSVIAVQNGTSRDITSLVNSTGDKYDVWPVAIVAVIENESALQVYAYHHWSAVDYSCGLMQEIVANVAQYEGITNPDAACQWEYDPAHSIDLGTRIMLACQSYKAGAIPWPYLYVGYNAGCGVPNEEFYNPCAYNSIACQAFTNFLGNYNIALSQYAGGVSPTPTPIPRPTSKPTKPFPVKKWGAKPYRKHGKLVWPASVFLTHQRLGAYRGARYHPGRHKGRMTYRYQRGSANCWFASHRCRVLFHS